MAKKYTSQTQVLEFIHIPKTAGLSICNTIGQRTGHGVRPTGSGSFVFSCVRNPYDRAVSLYYFLKDRSKQYKAQFMAEGETVNSFWEHKASHIRPIRFTQPQSSWLQDINLDKILRYETLENDWPAFALLHDLPALPHKNKSELRPVTPWQEELTAESIAKIGELYAEDFVNLNYERLI